MCPCSLAVDFFALLVQAFNQSESLNVATFREILEFVLTSPFGPQSLAALLQAMTADGTSLTVPAFTALLKAVGDAHRIPPSDLTALLEILSQ